MAERDVFVLFGIFEDLLGFLLKDDLVRDVTLLVDSRHRKPFGDSLGGDIEPFAESEEDTDCPELVVQRHLRQLLSASLLELVEMLPGNVIHVLEVFSSHHLRNLSSR
ncbi:hypothetical protein [Halomontanus rarus]|uniref:hypothetical protein n=1 Tax=Halomontanus rarus TaxID=3034020 RepID=UPI00293BF7FE|nr:hypothetical protein [Halovivax sp. KZCA124]